MVIGCSAGDTTAFRGSELEKWVKKLKNNWFVVADNGYPLSGTMLTPFESGELNGRSENVYLDSYITICLN